MFSDRSLHKRMADQVPKLKRGEVWCRKCGAHMQVDSSSCLRDGWPKCCGETMTIDSPEERGEDTKTGGYNQANLDVSNAIGLAANLRAVHMRLELMARTPKWLLRALARDIDKAERLVPPLVLRRRTFIRGPRT